jgi:hypothetical protein
VLGTTYLWMRHPQWPMLPRVPSRRRHRAVAVISLPWSAPAFLSVKGVLHQPDVKPTLKPEARDAILLAVAKALCWIEDLASGR